VLDHADCHSVSSRQPGQQQRSPTTVRAEIVSRHNEVMTTGGTKMSSTGHIRDRNAAVWQVLRSFLAEAVMHHRHKFEIHSLRRVEPMEVDIGWRHIQKTNLSIMLRTFCTLPAILVDNDISAYVEYPNIFATSLLHDKRNIHHYSTTKTHSITHRMFHGLSKIIYTYRMSAKSTLYLFVYIHLYV